MSSGKKGEYEDSSINLSRDKALACIPKRDPAFEAVR